MSDLRFDNWWMRLEEVGDTWCIRSGSDLFAIRLVTRKRVCANAFMAANPQTSLIATDRANRHYVVDTLPVGK